MIMVECSNIPFNTRINETAWLVIHRVWRCRRVLASLVDVSKNLVPWNGV